MNLHTHSFKNNAKKKEVILKTTRMSRKKKSIFVKQKRNTAPSSEGSDK